MLSGMQLKVMHTSSKVLLLQSFSERRRMVCSGVSSCMVCMALYFMLHASRVVETSSELLYDASLADSPDVALLPVFFGHNLRYWM